MSRSSSETEKAPGSRAACSRGCLVEGRRRPRATAIVFIATGVFLLLAADFSAGPARAAVPAERTASAAALPQPVLESRRDWVDLYWKGWETLARRVHRATAANGLVAWYIAAGPKGQLDQGAVCFAAAFARYARGEIPSIVSLDNFYRKQQPDGYISPRIRESDGRPLWRGDKRSPVGPPLFSWAEWKSFEITANRRRVEYVLPILDRYYQWLKRNRRRPDGLYFEAEAQRPASARRWPAASIELTAQQGLNAWCLAALAKAAGARQLEAKYRAEWSGIGDLLRSKCWDKSASLYLPPAPGGSGRARRAARLADFWPLVAFPSDPAAPLLVAHLADPKEFWRPVPFPDLSARSPEYDDLGAPARGAVRPASSYALIEALSRAGFGDLAAEGARRAVAQMAKVFRETGALWSHYAPESPDAGRGAERGVPEAGCGAVALLIEYVLGFRVDGPGDQLLWRLHRTDRHGIRRLRFGDNTVDLLAEVRPSPLAPTTLTIRTDSAFLLRVRIAQSELKARIEPGTTLWRLDRSPRLVARPATKTAEAKAPKAPDDSVKSVSFGANEVDVRLAGGATVRLVFLEDRVLWFRLVGRGGRGRPLADSQASWPMAEVRARAGSLDYIFETEALRVVFPRKGPFRLAFFAKRAGGDSWTPLTEQPPREGLRFDGRTWRMALAAKNERFLGLAAGSGGRGEGLFRSGRWAIGRPRGNAIAAPFLISTAGYGILLNTRGRAEISPGEGGEPTRISAGGVPDFYFIAARSSPGEIVALFNALAGRAPVPPKAAAGPLAFWCGATPPASVPQSKGSVERWSRRLRRSGLPVSVWPYVVCELGKGSGRREGRATAFTGGGLASAKRNWEKMRATPRLMNVRTLALYRSGTAGMARYGAAWVSEAATADWDALRAQPVRILAAGILGFGLAGSPPPPSAGRGSRELFLRWAEMSACLPLDLVPVEAPAESPGKGRSGEVRSLLEDAGTVRNLRRRLSPYIYACFRRYSRLGEPIVRPLFFEFPQTLELLGEKGKAVFFEREWMLGPNLLVAPVLEPAPQSGPARVRVFLPGGAWRDFFTGLPYRGGRIIEYDLAGQAAATGIADNWAAIPIFQRAGSIVPVLAQGGAGDSASTSPRRIDLRIVPTADDTGATSCTLELYNDDGETYAYRSGAFAVQRVSAETLADRNLLRVVIGKPRGEREYRWIIESVEIALDRPPRGVSINGSPVGAGRSRPPFYRFDPKGRRLSVVPDLAKSPPDRPLVISVRLAGR